MFAQTLEEIEENLFWKGNDLLVRLGDSSFRIQRTNGVTYHVLASDGEVIEDFTSVEEALLFLLTPSLSYQEKEQWYG